jgi:hypothetical protein
MSRSMHRTTAVRNSCGDKGWRRSRDWFGRHIPAIKGLMWFLPIVWRHFSDANLTKIPTSFSYSVSGRVFHRLAYHYCGEDGYGDGDINLETMATSKRWPSTAISKMGFISNISTVMTFHFVRFSQRCQIVNMNLRMTFHFFNW